MAIEAKVLADSIANGHRLTTFQLKFPRFILAEFNTHRALSRNASSSRAIPVKKVLQMVRGDPAMPVFWGKNQPGMLAEEEISGVVKDIAIRRWLRFRDDAVHEAEWFEYNGIHKQLSNRLVELWMNAHVVCTGTEWENFYALRTDKMAQPEMKVLADTMLEAHNASTPVSREPFNWHLPYISEEDRRILLFPNAVKVSVARCARVSLVNHDGTTHNLGRDMELHDQLKNNGHVSPFEHQARPAVDDETGSGNFRGWMQYRYFLPNENRSFEGLWRIS